MCLGSGVQRLRRSHPRGRAARRSTGAGADQVRACDQPRDREEARSRRADDPSRPRGRGERPVTSACYRRPLATSSSFGLSSKRAPFCCRPKPISDRGQNSRADRVHDRKHGTRRLARGTVQPHIRDPWHRNPGRRWDKGRTRNGDMRHPARGTFHLRIRWR
jgi:hypothetical protein